jgi:hypothetical protein
LVDEVLATAVGEERYRLAGIFNLNKLARRFEAMVERANRRNYPDAA